MAITDKRIVTGVTGGAGGMTNVGTGADVTWPTSGNPSLANSGCYFTNAEGSSLINLTTASDRGTLTAWDSGSPSKAKPWWATGNAFVDVPQARDGMCMGFLDNTESNALSSTLTTGVGQAEIDFEAGYLFTIGFQIYTDPTAINHTADPTITPAHLPGGQSFSQVTDGGVTYGQLRGNPMNAGGFHPGVLLTNGNYGTGWEDVLSVSGSTNGCHLMFNTWYPLQVWFRRSTGAAVADGEIRWYVGGSLVSRVTNTIVWFTNHWRMQHTASLMDGWGTARTGVNFRWCAPVKFQAVPEADLPTALITTWRDNTELDLDLRRHWPVLCPVHPVKLTTVSGTPTVPTAGRLLNTGGVLRGMAMLPMGGDNTEIQKIEWPAVWDQDVNTDPRGDDGWVHVSFNAFLPNGNDITFTVRNAGDTADLLYCRFNDSGTGAFTINDNAIASGRTRLPANKWWQVILSMRGTEGRVTLANLTEESIVDGMCEVWSAEANSTVGGAIGKPQAIVTNVGGKCSRIGSLTVNAEYTVSVGDSFTSALSASNTYAISNANQTTDTVTVANMKAGNARSRKPEVGDLVRITGSTGNDGWWTCESSTDTTITIVEELPSAVGNGSVDLGAPGINCLANRLGQQFPDRYDSDGIPGHYRFGHPLYLNNWLNRVHPLLNLARSGGRLTELLNNVLPDCTAMPSPKFLCMCFDVNDSSDTTTPSACLAQAHALADNKMLLIDWVAARSGRIILTSGLNGQNAGAVMNGWARRFRRITMAQVNNIVEYEVRTGSQYNGKALLLDPEPFMDAGSITFASDGLHPDSGTAQAFIAGMHLAAEATETMPGFNSDGSFAAVRGGARSGSIGSPIGTG